MNTEQMGREEKAALYLAEGIDPSVFIMSDWAILQSPADADFLNRLQVDLFKQDRKEVVVAALRGYKRKDWTRQGLNAKAYCLVLTLDRERHGLFGDPRLHRAKLKSSGASSLEKGKQRNLKDLLKLEIETSDSTSLRLVFRNKIEEWIPQDQSSESLARWTWWTVQLVTVYYSNTLWTRGLDDKLMARITSAWAEVARDHQPNASNHRSKYSKPSPASVFSKSLNQAQRSFLTLFLRQMTQAGALHLDGTAPSAEAVGEQREAGLEGVLQEEGAETVFISPEETEEVMSFLKDAGLDVSDIHRLENYLMDRLGRLQNESVLAVHLATPRSHALEDHSPATGVPPAMDPSRAKGSLPQIPMEQQTDSEVAMDQMDRAIHQADQMATWIREYDTQLGRMRENIKIIESRNNSLQIQERNEARLEDLLKNLLGSLELEYPYARARLSRPDFHTDLEHIIEASKELDSLIDRPLEPGLDQLRAVNERLADFQQLRLSFSQNARLFLEGKLMKPGTSEKDGNLPAGGLLPIVRTHQDLLKFKDLVLRLQVQDTQLLRKAYLKHAGSVYEKQLRILFHTVLKQELKSHARTGSMSLVSSPVSGPPEFSLANMPEVALEHLDAVGNLPEVYIPQAREVFEQMWDTVIPTCRQEEAFLWQFFFSDVAEEDGGKACEPPIAAEPHAEELKEAGIQLASRRENCHRHVQSMMQTLFSGLTESMRQLLKESVRQDSLNALEMVVQCRAQLQLLQTQQLQTDMGEIGFLRRLLGEGLDEDEDLNLRGSPSANRFRINVNGLINSIINNTGSASTSNLMQSDCIAAAAIHMCVEWLAKQVRWISTRKTEAKRAGVLGPVAKFPVVIERIELLLHSYDQRMKTLHKESYRPLARLKLVDRIYETIQTELFNLLERVASYEDAKKKKVYGDIVLMENYHFCFHAFRRWASSPQALELALPDSNDPSSRRSSLVGSARTGSTPHSRRSSVLEREGSVLSSSGGGNTVPGLPRAPAPPPAAIARGSASVPPPPQPSLPRRGSMSVLLDSDFESSLSRVSEPPTVETNPISPGDESVLSVSEWSEDGDSSPQGIRSLEAAAMKAGRLYKDRLVKYARWHLEYDLMEPVAKFLWLMRSTLDSGVSENDIAFTQGLGKNDYRDLVRSHLQSKPLNRKLQSMLQRLRKHLNNKNADLTHEVWSQVKQSFIARMTWFQQAARRCYGESLPLTIPQIQAMFRSILPPR